MSVTKSTLTALDCRVNKLLAVILVTLSVFITACTTTPLLPYTEDTPPLVLLPASQAGIEDKRGRFGEIFCAILEQRQATLTDYRTCDEALTKVGVMPDRTGRSVDLGPAKRRLVSVIVPGIGWDCVIEWLDVKETAATHIRQFGYDHVAISVDALSSSANNARQIRDAIMAMELEDTEPQLVLIGYSKGTPDILEAVVTYPEIRQYIAAVVSAGGAVGGSPLANKYTQSDIDMLRNWPGAKCSAGDGGAMESLRPSVRRSWLANNSLPRDFPYYSLVTYPKPERISSILGSSYNKLSRVDARNDGQLLFYDQVIPGSALIGYINSDHWAVAIPVARSHETIGSIFVDQNDYPREALLEAILRFVEEDLASLPSYKK